ncbi:MAG: hypothetical protein M3349_04245 [Actinomycetota bacterium]|nr:hypothetical protein [Actinomycetota bacterium]
MLVALGGAGGVIGTLSGIIYKLMTARITALEVENKGLRDEAKLAVSAKEAEIATLRDIAANLAAERARQDVARKRANP